VGVGLVDQAAQDGFSADLLCKIHVITAARVRCVRGQIAAERDV
jgi:hypothetical protein